jgi:ketosteroid isomerase-like protein
VDGCGRDTFGAVSQENVEAVRRSYEAYNAGDLATLRDGLHPDIVMYHLEGWPEPGPSLGPDAVMREYEQLREAWRGEDSVEHGELIEAGDHVLSKDVWRGSGTGPDAVMEFTSIFTFREGKVITIRRFWDHDEALEAVGLSREQVAE